MKKKVFGVGINDSPEPVGRTVNGSRVHCHYYTTWQEMLRRVYSPRSLAKYPTYADCSVCEEWLLFSNFKAWMETQDWEGKCLDKDIIRPGNKHYSPETCCFIEHRTNLLITRKQRDRGRWPIGVSYHTRANAFYAHCRIPGKGTTHLGTFKTPEDAHRAYVAKKVEILHAVAFEQTDPRIASGLRAHAARLIMAGEQL